MSLLSVCQSAAAYVGDNIPASIVGNDDEGAVRLFYLAKQELMNLSRRRNWTALKRLHTFSTVAGDPDYALPDDFGWFISHTLWNRSEQDPISGPISDRVWQTWESGVLVPVVNDNFRIFPTSGVNQFHIQPTPSSVETMAFEYCTSNFATTAGGADLPMYASDTDTSKVEEHLIQLGVTWRLLARTGFEFAIEHSEYESQVEMAMARDGGNHDLMISEGILDPAMAGYTPESGFGL